MDEDRAPLVLLVDDDPNDEELARVALRRTGLAHRLSVVRDGAEALDWLFGEGEHQGRDTREMPRVVLLDLKLPKLTGLEVVEAVRKDERTKAVPLVVFTSSNEENDLRESYRLGVNAYVRKPVDFNEYKKLVADVGAFWIIHNRAPDDGGGGVAA
jgi:two-component system, response regulator